MLRTVAMLATLATLMSVSGCRREPEFARVDAALAPLIPPDAAAIACVRLDRIKKTWFHDEFISTRKIPELERFADQTGLDLRKDVWELLYVFHGGGAPPVVLIRGKFGGSFGLEPQFDKPGLQRMSYKGYYIIYGDGPAVMFLNTGAAAAGRIEDLRRLIDRRDEPGWRTNQEMLDLAGTLPGTTPFWLVAPRAGDLLPDLPADGALAAAIPLARSLGPLTLHTSLADGLSLTVRAGFPDAATARQAATGLRALVELSRARSADTPAAQVAFQVTSQETEVEITARTPQTLAGDLLRFIPGATE
jgi:hypothetical protein